ncbi:Hsp70 family protein [Frankia sp. AgB1.9]|uniref:Hsp70 family protein n=1 Tax=unclassified Frankia TaxID=2632575 RepID=UPI0019336E2C|nr:MULTISPECIES: Hsp70 family protein [unclassified Frankia]MBL7491024.1 Hsp70 family protein [Frankia sp. AgW1.1]MBL7548165.1 Hsp70 family protein [Frankia sp. AgB1.9]MBL7620391.1 Hsp70 family protein [Frankia sp. AgB1.8]
MAREWLLAVDLGTTWTKAAYTTADSADPVLVRVPATQLAWFPTAVGRASDGRWLVGEAAQARRVSRPDWCWGDIKRDLGQREPRMLGGHPFAAAEAVSQPLLHAARLARRQAGRGFDRLVLSAPVTFTPDQHAALLEAGENAGFAPDTITIVDEAAAASRSVLGPRPEDGTWAVVDVGGGTFDAALVTANRGVAAVLDQVGDDQAGGHSIDTAIVTRLRELYQIDDGDGEAGRRRASYLRDAARMLREQLAEQRSADVFLPDLLLELSLTPAQLGELVEPVLAPAIERCTAMLTRNDLDWAKINGLVLSGGATRDPAVRARLAPLAPVRDAANPELAVVLGLTVPAEAPSRTILSLKY